MITGKTLDTETKLKLLISLINDEGKEKLENSMDKLVIRIKENLNNFSNEINSLLVKG